MSLMSSLYTGTSGLRVSQSAINTTAHNLANVDTRGYSRQQVNIIDGKYQNIGRNNISTFQVGMGTDIQQIYIFRNVFYDKAYRENNGRLGFYTAQNEAVNEIENLFGEMEGVQFQESISGLWKSLQNLSNNPSDIVVRAEFTSSCVSFVERSKKIMNQLSENQKSLNTNITMQVDKVNEYGKKIAELNVKIAQAEAGGTQKANDYRDERDNYLDELSNLVKISYYENKNGQVTVSIEGVNFVLDGSYNAMSTTEVDEVSGMIKPVWKHLGGKDVFQEGETVSTENDNNMGYLKGLILGRGSKKADYTMIPKKPVREDFNTDAEFNAANAKYKDDLKEYNNTLGVSTVMRVQAQLDRLVHGIVTTINDVLCPNKTIIDPVSGKEIKVLDVENAPIGMDSEKKAGVELFVRNNMERYTEKVIGGKTYLVYNEEDASNPYSLYTIDQISVNNEILNNNSKLPLSDKNGVGHDQKVCDALTQKWNEAFEMLTPESLTKFNFNSYYTNMIGELSNVGNQFLKLAQTQQLALNTIDGERMAVSGVSSDEELTNMIRFQHAYNANSRYITTVNDMLETLLNL